MATSPARTLEPLRRQLLLTVPPLPRLPYLLLCRRLVVDPAGRKDPGGGRLALFHPPRRSVRLHKAPRHYRATSSTVQAPDLHRPRRHRRRRRLCRRPAPLRPRLHQHQRMRLGRSEPGPPFLLRSAGSRSGRKRLRVPGGQLRHQQDLCPKDG